MNKMFLRPGLVMVMMCVMFASCKKADVTATATDPQLTFALVPDNPNVVFNTSPATIKPTFTWSAGIANITRFRLNAKRGGVAAEYSSASLSNVDLFALPVSFSSLSIPKGDYTEVKGAIIFSSVVAPPYPMVLTGTYTTDGGTVYPVEFDLNDNVEISVAISNIIADGSKDFTANMALHLNVLLNGIAAADLSAATKPNGIILISKTSNATLYNKIKANMLVCSGTSLSSKAK